MTIKKPTPTFGETSASDSQTVSLVQLLKNDSNSANLAAVDHTANANCRTLKSKVHTLEQKKA